MHEALLTIAHGTRDPRGAQEMATLLDLVRARVDVPVENGWLEDFAAPSVQEAVDRLVEGGAAHLVAVPLLNFAAGHAKYDVPRELTAARTRHPHLTIAATGVLGIHPRLLDLAEARVRAAGGGSSGDAVLLVVASGSSDADANGDVAKAARMLAERTGHEWVEIAFAGVTWPRVDRAVRRVAAAGAREIVLFSWSLLAGLLEQGARAEVEASAAAVGVRVRDAGRFGPDPLLADVVVDRYGGGSPRGA